MFRVSVTLFGRTTGRDCANIGEELKDAQAFAENGMTVTISPIAQQEKKQ